MRSGTQTLCQVVRAWGVCLSVVASAFADTIHVPADQPTIQAGIDAAVNGDGVLVAPGSYNEAIDFHGKAITVQSSGGAAATTIDGTGLDASVVNFIGGEGPDSVLNGFTITGGAGTLISNTRYGGGVYMVNSGAIISSCVMHGNNAPLGGGVYAEGGAPSIMNCTFLTNSATYGGGIYPMNSAIIVSGCVLQGNVATEGAGMYVKQGSAHVLDCVFDDNDTQFCNDDAAPPPSFTTGGGIRTDAADLTVEDCLIVNNCGVFGGGGISVWGNTCTVRRTTFRNNREAILLFYSLRDLHTIEDCLFEENFGGAVRVFPTGATFRGCVFRRNTSGDSGALQIGGGNTPNSVGIHQCEFDGNSGNDGGAIQVGIKATVQITESKFTNNLATGESFPPDYHVGGGAVSAWGGTTTIVNSLMRGNAASNGHGGAVLSQAQSTNSPAVISLINCSLSGNTAPTTMTGGVVNAPSFGPSTINAVNTIIWNNQGAQIITDPGSTTNVSYCDVQGGAPGGGGGTGNIDAEPMFVSATDLQLMRGSPCIDAGSNAAIPPGVTSDLAGNPRVSGGIVDMGAYEFGACWGDIAPSGGNGIVNVDDLLAIVNGWGSTGPPWSMAADTNGDGVVNIDDLLMIVNHWGPC